MERRRRVFLDASMRLAGTVPQGVGIYRVHAEPGALREMLMESGLPREGIIRAENLPCAMLLLNPPGRLKVYFPATSRNKLPVAGVVSWLAGDAVVSEALTSAHEAGDRSYQSLEIPLAWGRITAVTVCMIHDSPLLSQNSPHTLWVSVRHQHQKGGVRVGLHWLESGADPASALGQAFVEAEISRARKSRVRISGLPLPEADLLIADTTEEIAGLALVLVARNIFSAEQISAAGGVALAEA